MAEHLQRSPTATRALLHRARGRLRAASEPSTEDRSLRESPGAPKRSGGSTVRVVRRGREQAVRRSVGV
jgi:hypothetical protein